MTTFLTVWVKYGFLIIFNAHKISLISVNCYISSGHWRPIVFWIVIDDTNKDYLLIFFFKLLLSRNEIKLKRKNIKALLKHSIIQYAYPTSPKERESEVKLIKKSQNSKIGNKAYKVLMSTIICHKYKLKWTVPHKCICFASHYPHSNFTGFSKSSFITSRSLFI